MRNQAGGAQAGRTHAGTKPAGRKPASGKAGGKPVTTHPLFPAIVALWFGALFGLGSLAIRPALLEALVLKLHLDLVIPAAAPPLGMTARILLSLGMALAGACLGALVARRIARPRPEVRERRRAMVPAASRDSAAAPAPAASLVTEASPSRRRALAIEEDYEPNYYHENAPLPGGAPQILDVSEFDFAQEESPVREPELVAAPSPVAAGALDLSGFLASEAKAADLPVAEVAGETAPDAAPPSAFSQPAFSQPAFSQPAFSQPAFSQPAFAAPLESNPAPAMMPFAPPPAQAAPFASPIAAAPAPDFAPTPAPASASAPAPAMLAPDRAEPALLDMDDDDAAVDQLHAAALEALSQVELMERLARALQRRRDLAGSTAAAAYAAPAAAAPEWPAEPDMAPQPEVQPEARWGLGEQSDLGEQPPVISTERLFAAPAAPAPAFQAATPVDDMPAELAPAEAPAEAIVPPPIVMPAALRPISLELTDGDDDDDFAAFLPLRHIAMPAATGMAPEPKPELEAEAGPAFAPVLPEPPVLPESPAGQAFAAPVAPNSEPLAPEPLAPEFLTPEPVAEAEDDALADGYSSLLDLSRPAALRSGFVRIEDAPVDESEADATAPEPVVVFPGQAQRFASAHAAPAMAAAPSAPPASFAAPSEGAAHLRRFDAPASIVPGTPPVSAAPVVLQDREEAERALRTALATLQRMSATG